MSTDSPVDNAFELWIDRRLLWTTGVLAVEEATKASADARAVR
jgi:hypothetical protein